MRTPAGTGNAKSLLKRYADPVATDTKVLESQRAESGGHRKVLKVRANPTRKGNHNQRPVYAKGYGVCNAYGK